jgi:hypothetical protein
MRYIVVRICAFFDGYCLMFVQAFTGSPEQDAGTAP